MLLFAVGLLLVACFHASRTTIFLVCMLSFIILHDWSLAVFLLFLVPRFHKSSTLHDFHQALIDPAA
ncbi:hypothetical protein BCR44DRAFT_36368, partial [Catenaria anguillulae PL171]